MIFGANFKTFAILAALVLVALYVPMYIGWGLTGIALLVAMATLITNRAPSTYRDDQKPYAWLQSAKAMGFLSLMGLFGAIVSVRTINIMDLQPRTSELATGIISAAMFTVFAFAGLMLSNTLKSQAIRSQRRLDEEAARAAGNGPKCTCTRKCGMC